MEAAALYLKEIRKGRGLTQEMLADLVGVGKRTIERLERNEGSITADTFEQIIAVLRASAEHVHFLVTSLDASNDDATRLAKLLLEEKKEIDNFVADIVQGDKVSEAIKLIQQLESDPSALDRLLGYGQSLIDQKR